MNEEIARLLGINPQQAQSDALNRAFLTGLLQVAALSGPQRQPVATAPALAQAVMGGMGAYESSIDKTLKDALTSLQLRNMVQKQQEQQQLQRLLPQVMQVQRGPATQEVIASEQGDDVLTREGPVTGVGINRQMLPALAAIPGGLEVATNLAKFQETMYPKPEYLTVGETVYLKKPEGGLEKVVSSGGKFTGDFANYAVGLYGTADAAEILSKDPNAMSQIESGVLAKAKAGASSVNLPSGEERKAGFLANRVKFNLDLMSDIIKKNPPAASPEAVPSIVRYLSGSEFLSNKLTTTDRQRIEAAQRDVLDAALTLGTGAAYTREQLEGYRLSYFPQLSDDAATVKDKQARLQNLLESSYITAGRAAPTAAATRAPEAPPAPSAAGKAPTGVPQNLWDVMTPAERALWPSR